MWLYALKRTGLADKMSGKDTENQKADLLDTTVCWPLGVIILALTMAACALIGARYKETA